MVVSVWGCVYGGEAGSVCVCAKVGMINGMCERQGECVCPGDCIKVGPCVLGRGYCFCWGVCVCVFAC